MTQPVRPVYTKPLRPAFALALVLLALGLMLAGADLLSPARILGWLTIAAGVGAVVLVAADRAL